MALMHSFAKFNTFVPRLSVRFFSVSTEKEVKKSVFVSQSKDVYTNLALQEWIHKNVDFESHHVLMIAQNDPCVVLGRDQNPWLQTNIDQLDYITENGTRLARGTHSGNSSFMDNGNLNLTFFTPSKVHNTRYNLEVIRRALFREYSTKVDINNKYLMKRNFKLSESGEKVCDLSTYHQCSLLVDTNKLNMDIALQKPKEMLNNFNQKASPTLKVMNLREENSKINVSSLLNSIGWEYLRTTPYELKDGGMDLANKQKGFQLLCPTEKWFPGLDEIKENLMSWEWCLGETPKFTISRSIHVPQHLIANSFEPSEDLKINLTVSKGLIDEVFFNIPSSLSNFNMSGEIRAMTALKGRRFGLDALKSFEYCLDHMVEDNTEYAKKFAAAI